MKTLQNTVQKFMKEFFHKKNSEKNMINTVEPKRYTKSQLAALYNRPVKTLMRWIHDDKELMEELKELGYNHYQKEFKKEQIRIIFDYIGEPDCPK